MIDEIAQINVRDGTSIGARIYRPDGAGLIRPARGCALPLVNNNLPASAQFLWREMGLAIIGPLVGALFVGLPVATDVWCRRGESDPRRHQKQTALSRLIDDDAPTAPAHGVFLARRGLGRRCLTDTSALGPWPTGDASQTSAVGRVRRCEAPHVTGIPL